MSKPMVVTLPCVLLLLDFWPLGRGLRVEGRGEAAATDHGARITFHAPAFLRLMREKLPFLILCAAGSAVTYLVQRAGGATASWQSLPLTLRAGNPLISYIRYISKTILPASLSILYNYPEHLKIRWLLASSLMLALTPRLSLT